MIDYSGKWHQRVFPVAVLGLVFLFSAWVPVSDYGFSRELEAFRYASYSGAALLLVSGVGWFWNGRFQKLSAVIGVPLAILILYWVMSLVWSEDPVQTGQKVFLLMITVAASFAAASAVSASRIVTLAAWVIFGYVFAGAVVAIAFPDLGLETSFFHEGKWKGLSGQKNTFGMLSALSALLLLASREEREGAQYRRCAAVAALISVACVWMSGSRGAMVDFVIGFGVLLLYAFKPRYRLFLVFLLVWCVVALLLVAATTVEVHGSIFRLGAFEIDSSNRTTIWQFGFQEMQGRELVGAGFGGFWTQSRQDIFAGANGWVLPNFHNGYVSLAIESGLLGLLIFSVLLVAMSRRLFEVVLGRSALHIGVVLIVVFFLSHNFYENHITRSTDVLLLLFLIACMLIGQPRRLRCLGWRAGSLPSSSRRYPRCGSV